MYCEELALKTLSKLLTFPAAEIAGSWEWDDGWWGGGGGGGGGAMTESR